MDVKSEFIPAFRLMSTADGGSCFQQGKIPTLTPMNTTSFWISTITEDWEKNVHPAPRRQYVVTLKGNILFKVSDGSTFLIKPGIILIAEDTDGVGHSWDIMEGDKWERLYIPIAEGADDFFIPESE